MTSVHPETAAGSLFAANRAFGRIDLAVKHHAGISRRARVFEDGPLRVRFTGAPGREAQGVIVNTAGGIAGGDRHHIRIVVEDDASLLVTTAAAEKVYRSLDPAAEIGITLAVGAGARLAWMPQETILFDAARLVRGIDVDLAPDAGLLLAEAVVFGRTAMGEAVTHGTFVDRWRVRRAGRLIHAETARLDGAIAEHLAVPAVARGGTALATILIAPGDEATVEAVRGHVQDCAGEVGASAWNGVALVRLCAADGATLHRDLALILSILRGTPLPRLWLG